MGLCARMLLSFLETIWSFQGLLSVFVRQIQRGLSNLRLSNKTNLDFYWDITILRTLFNSLYIERSFHTTVWKSNCFQFSGVSAIFSTCSFLVVLSTALLVSCCGCVDEYSAEGTRGILYRSLEFGLSLYIALFSLVFCLVNSSCLASLNSELYPFYPVRPGPCFLPPTCDLKPAFMQ